MDEILKAVGNYGFPIVVAAYLLVRFEAKLDQIAASISGLSATIESLSRQGEGHGDD